MNEWMQVVGRFHPLVLHVPIGLVTGLAAVESLSFMVTNLKSKNEYLVILRALAALTAISAVLAATTGYILNLSGEFHGETVDLHLKAGIAFAIATVVAAVCSGIKSSPWPRRAALGVCCLILIPAGHLGGTITHGENFLFAPLEKNTVGKGRESRLEHLEDASSTPTHFTSVVLPILLDKCVSCHGENKQKGDLAVHNGDSLMKGGEDGPVVVAGDVSRSELVRRMRLSLKDKEHMPPAAKPQPTEAEIALIEAWIAGGASLTAPPSEIASTPSRTQLAPPESTAASHQSPASAVPKAAPAAPSEALSALREHLVHVAPIEQGASLLVVDFAAVATQVDDRSVEQLLKPVGEYVADLSLARCKVTDQSLKLFGTMPHLARLDLRGTSITSEGLAALKGAPKLADLILAQTAVDEKAVDVLAAFPSLRHVFLWQSHIPQDALVRLRALKPSLLVDAGDHATTTIAAAETEVKFTSDAPPLGQVAAAPDLKPVNSVCPVSGNPVDPKYAVVYKGKVVGFCCPNCPKDFWSDPTKFESKIAELSK